MEEITMNGLLKIRKCEKLYRYDNLVFSSSERFLLNNSFGVIKNCLADGVGREECLRCVSDFIRSEADESWFENHVQMRKKIDRDIRKLERFINYLYSVVGFIHGVDVPYFLSMPNTKYKGIRFDQIRGRADIVFVNKVTGDIEVAVFKVGENPYSKQARSERNKVHSNMELQGLKLGFMGRFSKFRVLQYYLDNKDDKGDSLMEYEHKDFKNICYERSEGDANEAMELFCKAATLCDNVECSSCRQADVCRFNREVRMDYEVNTLKTATKAPMANPTFTKEQERVVHHVDGPMNVIAVPGAGKTYCLVQRMKHLIQLGIPAKKILFVTFSRMAAEEISERVCNELSTTAGGELPSVYTFNGLGYEILKENPTIVGNRLKLADDMKRLSLIRDIILEMPDIEGANYDGLCLEYGLVKLMDQWFKKIDSVGKEAFLSSYKGPVSSRDILAVYDRYVAVFEQEGYCTYDQQIILCNQMFTRLPNLAKLYSKKYSYIMVDEFQDASAENAEFIYHIAKKHNNIVVVGDDDQSIYAFRGGTNRFLLQFAEDFKDAETVILADNFRSSESILNVSAALINKNEKRFEKEFVSHKQANGRPILVKNFTPEKAVAWVKRLQEHGFQCGDIAILARRNKSLMEIAEFLKDAGIDSNSPKDYLIEDSVFLAVYDVLTLCSNGYGNDKAAYRLLSWCGAESQIIRTDKNVSLLEDVLTSNGLPMYPSDGNWSVYHRLEPHTEIEDAAKRIALAIEFVEHEQNIPAMLKEVAKWIFGIDEHPVINELLNIADEQAVAKPGELYRYMTDMILFRDTRRVGYGTNRNKVNLLTCHDSKGKEFPAVIIYGAEEFEDCEEDRRLLYVAMTRAMKSLIITETINSYSKLTDEYVGQTRVC